MIIDTDKLKDAIDICEENKAIARGGWEKCSMQFLTQSEGTVLRLKGIVEEVEQLALNLLETGNWPTK